MTSPINLKFVFLLFFAFFVFLLAVPFQSAQGVSQCAIYGLCGGTPPSCPSWTEYQCGPQLCPGEIQTRQMIGTSVCLGTLSTSCGWECEYKYTPWVHESFGQPWQVCVDDGNLRTRPHYTCSGQCLETPQNPRYYDDPTYSDKPDKSKDPNNIFLPVKLDWDDVEGWKAAPDGPQSYRISIPNTSQGNFSQALPESEFIMPEACFLKSDTSYNWQAQACCTADGQNCGPTSSWDFKTNLAPEPVSPNDPDWAGPKGRKDVLFSSSTQVALDWCDVKEAEYYKLRFYLKDGEGKKCHPWLITPDGCDTVLVIKQPTETFPIFALPSRFDDYLGYFSRDTGYFWEVASYFIEGGKPIETFSQLWQFNTVGKLPTFNPVYPPNDPEGEKPVGLPLILDWEAKPGINSFYYQYQKADEKDWLPISNFTQDSQSESLNTGELKLNTLYKWRVKSCWDYFATQCEDEFSPDQYFKTTGQPPRLIYPAAGAADITIPVNFDWEDVDGAKSYILNLQGDGLNVATSTEKSELPIDYPQFNINQETNYSWQVKTCAWENGWACGDYGGKQSFKTFKILPPRNPSYPKNEGMLFTDEHLLSWEKVIGAKAYQYEIKLLSLAPKEERQNCSVPPLSTALANSGYVELGCLGQYQWQVRSCLDGGCQKTSDWSDSWTFFFSEGGARKGGLVPCGRAANNTDTPWNEREPCEVKHIFLLIKTIIDFLLFRMAPIILALLAIATGAIFYTSLGKVTTMAQVISLWKSVGIGLGLIFFAWVIVNFFLKLAGYNIGVFGNWYEII